MNGRLFIGGSSLPENIIEFYTPVFKWIEEYARNANELTFVTFQFEYLNTGSTNIMARIIEALQCITKKDKAVRFSWQYFSGDYDIKELADELFDAPGCNYIIEEVSYQHAP